MGGDTRPSFSLGLATRARVEGHCLPLRSFAEQSRGSAAWIAINSEEVGVGPEAWAQIHTQTTCPTWVEASPGQVGHPRELCLSVCPSTPWPPGQGAVIPSSTQPRSSLGLFVHLSFSKRPLGTSSFRILSGPHNNLSRRVVPLYHRRN